MIFIITNTFAKSFLQIARVVVIKIVPNILTTLNMGCGFFSVVMAAIFRFEEAGWLILIAALLDFLDGFTARALNATSALGAQLDSLADIVSFGVAPSFLAFQLIQLSNESVHITEFNWWASFAVLGVMFAGIRLARFNASLSKGDKSDSFQGLPSPAFGLFWAGMAIGSPYTGKTVSSSEIQGFIAGIYEEISVLIPLIIFSSVAMVLNVRMFSLKFSSFGWKENKLRYIFLGLCLAIIVLGISLKTIGPALAASIVLYVFLSIIRQFIID